MILKMLISQSIIGNISLEQLVNCTCAKRECRLFFISWHYISGYQANSLELNIQSQEVKNRKNKLQTKLLTYFKDFLEDNYKQETEEMTMISLLPDSNEETVDILIFSNSSLMDRSFSIKTPVTGIKASGW